MSAIDLEVSVPETTTKDKRISGDGGAKPSKVQQLMKSEAALLISRAMFIILCPKKVKGEKKTQTEHTGDQKWGRRGR